MEELSFTLSQIIGETISSVRWTYDPYNEQGLQEFHSFIKLSNATIIRIPVYNDEVLFVLNEINKQYFQEGYDKGNRLSDFAREIIEGQIIEDIFFAYDNGKISEDRRAYLKLSSGYYFSEINYCPAGMNETGIVILRESEFEARVRSNKVDVRTYLNRVR